MKVVKNDNNHNPQTLAEIEACQQFEARNQDGQVLFHPQVAAGRPVPNFVALYKEIGRFAVTTLEGRHSVEGGDWWHHEANGIQKPIDNPLEAAWQAAKSVRIALEPKLGFQPYVIAVVWFPDMEENDDILDEADGRSVHLLFGKIDLVQRLANLPTEGQLQGQLSSRYIEQEVATLSRPSTAAMEQEPAKTSHPVKGRVGALILEQVGTVNIYITIANGDGDEDPPLITVRGQ